MNDPSDQRGLQHYRIGFSPFWGADLIIDVDTKIVSTVQKNIIRGGYFLDFRGMSPSVSLESDIQGWEVEYFCENEGIISTRTNGEWSTSFYAYLNSKFDWYIENQNKAFNATSFWSPGLGSMHSIIPVELHEWRLPAVSIKDQTYIERASNIALSNTEIGNPSSDTVDFIYCYQDAAYLWFPRGNQQSVVPFLGSISTFGVVNIDFYHQGVLVCDDSYPVVFSGNIDFRHGVCAILFSVSPASRIGNIDRYIGIAKQVVDTNGTTYSVLDKDNPTSYEDRPRVGIYPCSSVSTSFMRSLFFWVDGVLNSWDTVKHKWGRFMFHQECGFASEEDVTALIKAHMSKLKF